MLSRPARLDGIGEDRDSEFDTEFGKPLMLTLLERR
jgi:hypothetical protein